MHRALAGLNEVSYLTAEECPLKVTLWRILVEPVEPRTQSSGEHGSAIALPEDVQMAEEVVCQYGRVIALGHFANKSKTASGLDLSEDPLKPRVGDIVSHQRFAGEVHHLRDGRKVRVIDDTDVTAIISDIEQIRIYT